MFLPPPIVGLLDGSLKNTGNWQFQCRWDKILSYLHMHCPALLSFLYWTRSQNTGQSGYIPDTWQPYPILTVIHLCIMLYTYWTLLHEEEEEQCSELV